MSGIFGFVEALDVVLTHAGGVCVPGGEMVDLLDSVGRVLAEEIQADRDQPPFDRSTRDGFAVRAEAWTAGKRLRVAGLVRAGERWEGGALGQGEAVEIMTGAALVDGADAVAMIEHAVQADGEVWAEAGRKLAAGENIVRRGSEARRGEAVVGAGTRVGAAEVALATTCGKGAVRVFGRPRVAIVATGDELVEVGEAPGERQIRNSNGYALAALVALAGSEPVRMAIARDTREDVRARIEAGLGCDLLLLSGGVSAGKYDLVEETLAEFGAEFFFTGVRMQPGRPVVFGRVPARGGGRECYFFGLPGNPVSTQVTFHCFVEPMLRAMSGAGVAGPEFVQATLGEDVRAKAGLMRVLPASLRHDVVRPEVRLVGWQGSGDLAANARANCYAVLPDGAELKDGDVVSVLLR